MALSNFAKDYRNNALVGDMLAPRVPVPRQSYQYVVFDFSAQRLDRQTLRAAGDTPQEDRMSYSALPYFANSHALRARVPYEQEQYAQGLNFSLKQKATERLIAKLSLDRENYIAQLATNPANLTNTEALAGATMFDSYLGGNTSQPTEVIEYAKDTIRSVGVEPNALFLSSPVITALVNNPIIVERFKYTAGGAISLDQLSQVFGIKCYRAGAVVRDKNNVGSYAWGVSAVLAYVQDASSQEDLSAMKTFDWTEAPETAGGYGVLEFPDPQLDAKADIISADWYWDTRITAPEAMFTFTNCVSAPTLAAVPAPAAGY